MLNDRRKYQPTVRPRKKASSGFSIFGKGIPDEDKELTSARYELTRLETQFSDVARSIERVSRARKGEQAI